MNRIDEPYDASYLYWKHPSEMTLDELHEVGIAQWGHLNASGMPTEGLILVTRRWIDDLVEHQGVARAVGDALRGSLSV